MNICPKFKCPYCGMQQSVYMDAEVYSNYKIVRCDNEMGGCDEVFVLYVHVSYDSFVYKLVEGES